MAQPYAHPAQPGILFRDPAFLAQVPLSPTTVSQYFSLSPFFARSSTNEQLRMQSLAEPDGGARREPRELEEALRRFRGTEFVVAHAAPQPPPGLGLYVIHQRERWGPAREQTRLVDAFFCLDGNIARAPDLYAIVGNRVLAAVTAIQSSLSLAHDALPPFDPRAGFGWRIAAPEDEDEADSEDEAAANLGSGADAGASERIAQPAPAKRRRAQGTAASNGTA